MTIPTWLVEHRDLIVLGGGAIGVLITLVAAYRWWRGGPAHTRMGPIAVILGTILAGEGMWEVAVHNLHLVQWIAAVVFALFEVFVIGQILLSRHAVAVGKRRTAERHIRMALAGAALSGVIAASAGDSPAEVLLRLVAPSVSVAIVWMELTSVDVVETEVRQPSTWIWTPRRIGVELGLIRPGKEDLAVVDHARSVRRIVRAAAAADAGGWGSARAKRRLQRLALQADERMIRDAAAQLQRAAGIREALRTPAKAGTLDVEDRAALDDVRLTARRSAERVREDHMRMMAGIRSTPVVHPAAPDRPVVHPAAPDRPVVHPAAPDRPVDHSPPRSTPATPTVDQPAGPARTNGTAVAVRTAPPQRVTAPVDQAADQPSPRVREMAQAIRDEWTDTIPGRRAVMDRMGWTSAGLTQEAINLVRAERTAANKED